MHNETKVGKLGEERETLSTREASVILERKSIDW